MTKRWWCVLGVFALCASIAFATDPTTQPSHPSSTSHHKSSSTSSHSKKTSSKKSKHGKSSKSAHHGQKAIQSDRAREIQEALIREHCLDGTPSGTWDSKTKAALVKYQEDNGWQSKVVPDSRALIKLGLGPDHSKVLNPDTAAIPTAGATAQQHSESSRAQ